MNQKGFLILAARVIPLALTLLGTACGQIKTGGAGASSAAAPTTPVVAQGSLTPLNGKAVSGNALIYAGSGTGTFVVRLNGLSAPAENGLQLVIVAGGRTVASVPLRTVSGTQNYEISLGFTPSSWGQVNIHSTATNLDYGQALLVSMR